MSLPKIVTWLSLHADRHMARPRQKGGHRGRQLRPRLPNPAGERRVGCAAGCARVRKRWRTAAQPRHMGGPARDGAKWGKQPVVFPKGASGAGVRGKRVPRTAACGSLNCVVCARAGAGCFVNCVRGGRQQHAPRCGREHQPFLGGNFCSRQRESGAAGDRRRHQRGEPARPHDRVAARAG